MKFAVAIASCLLLGLSAAGARASEASLVSVDAADFGDADSHMRIEEIERHAHTSTLRLTYDRLGSSVWSSVFIMRGFCEVARSRGMEYFINLKEWEDPRGGRLYIAGFTNTKDADPAAEFGAEHAAGPGQDRGYMSVSECDLLW